MRKIIGARVQRLWPSLILTLDKENKSGNHCIVIVPEQYTLQAERDILSDLGLPGFFDIEVLSPSRLSQRIFALAGADARLCIDARGQSIAVARALTVCGKNLRYYGKSVEKNGFINQIGALIADLKRASVSADTLQAKTAQINDDLLKAKIADLALIYKQYERQLENRFVDGEDDLNLLIERIEASGIMTDAAVFVYGFDILTEDFCRMLTKTSEYAKSLNVYLVMEKASSPDGDCFKPVRDSAEKLLEMMKERSVPGILEWFKPVSLGASAEICHLEEMLLRSMPYPFHGYSDTIRLYAAPTPYAEAHFVAQQILKENENGIAFNDICVVFGDKSRYESVVSAVFSSYGIPIYITGKHSVIPHGAVRFLLASIRAATAGYRMEDVMSVAKSGFSMLNDEEGWQLENYAIAWGIKGRKWLEPFSKGNDKDRISAEQARRKIIEPIKKLQKGMREARDADASLRAIFTLLEDVKVYEHLASQESDLIKTGMEPQVIISRQVWKLLISLLDQLHELMSGERIPGRYAAVWLEAGLRASEISALPPAPECVTCGMIGNIICAEPKVVCMMGMNDGMQALPQNSLLNDDERKATEKVSDAYLGLDTDGHEMLARLDLWKALSAPQNRLYLSYSQATQEGSVLRPAQVLQQIRRIFPRLTEEGGISAVPEAMFPLAPAPALDAIAGKLRMHTLDGEWAEAWKWLCADPDWMSVTKALNDIVLQKTTQNELTGDVAARLFKKRILSISRLERYASCPYSHFVYFGLSPQPRLEWKIEPADAGNFYHSAMERFTRILPDIENWPIVTRKVSDDIMEEVLRPLTAKWTEGPMGDSARISVDGRRYVGICKRIAWTFTRGAQHSSFVPVGTEARFGYEDCILPALTLDMPDGSRVFVRGIIDRIDRYEGGKGLYLRVVDYKSGNQDLKAERIWRGLQLQLLLYLEAALYGYPGAEPAGAFYQQMDDPFITGTDGSGDDEKQITSNEDRPGDVLIDYALTLSTEDKIAHKLRLKGIALRDASVLRLMDDCDPPLTIAPMLKKNGEPKDHSPLFTLQQMKQLVRHGHNKAAEITALIRSGDIIVKPASDTFGNSECRRCDFAGVCRIDPMDGLEKTQVIEKMSFTELLQKIDLKIDAGE